MASCWRDDLLGLYSHEEGGSAEGGVGFRITAIFEQMKNHFVSRVAGNELL